MKIPPSNQGQHCPAPVPAARRLTFRSARTNTILPSRSALLRSPTLFLAMVATTREPAACAQG